MTMRRSSIGRAFQTFQGQKAAGPRALVIAVIGRAALDLDQGDPAAAGFFLSEDYRRYLELIGLPADYLPAGVDAADLLKLAGRPSRRPRLCCKMSQNVAIAAD
jgi:hypothetical protein